MIVELIGIDLFARVQLEFAVQRMLIGLPLLKELYACCLLHPALQNAAHALDCALSKLVGLAAIIVNASVCLIQAPYSRSTVDTVTY